MNDQRRVLICRKWGSTIRETVWQLMIEQLTFFKLIDMCDVNKTERTIRLPNGSQFIFMPLDEETKLLSLQNVSDVWIEEAFECSYDIIQQLNLRMRSKKPNQQLFLSFNPISKSSWLYEFCEGEKKPSSFLYHKSTYKDNKFLNEQYINEMLDMVRTNPAKAQVFVFGNWGVDVDGIVFPNHKTANFDIDELLKDKSLEVKIGCDLGYIDASTVSVSLWDKQNKKIYIIKEYYESRVTLDEVVAGMKAMGIGKLPVYVDSAEPRSIAYFNQLGINAKPSKKSNGSNKLYIEFLQNHEIIIHESCVHAQEDFDNFCYAKNRQTGLYESDKYTHEWSHFIDSTKYAYSDVYRNKKLKSFGWHLGI
jgi:phage terminase large subunit